MGQFATSAEFADRTGLALDSNELARADKLLARISTEIQAVARQNIFETADDVLTRQGTVDRRILLPERPVQSVASVAIDGTDLTEGTDWFRDGDEIVRKIFTFLAVDALDAWTFGRGFGYEWQTLTITYTHGYPAGEEPGFLKEICCEAAVRSWFNPASVAREEVGDTRTVFDNMRFSPSGLRLTSDEKAEIRRFFGNRGGSIAMRD
jgi:hypothetical protein